jgi:hypothetical protein
VKFEALLPKSLLPQQHKNKKEENKPNSHLGTEPVVKAGKRPPAIEDEWAKEPE